MMHVQTWWFSVVVYTWIKNECVSDVYRCQYFDFFGFGK